jgi:quercetin dioxygenase-like cupin family protein
MSELKPAPAIEQQVRRSVGDAGEAMDFGSVHWAARSEDPPGAEMTFGLATWLAGKGNAEHFHPNCEEILFVLEGEVEHTLGDQRTILRAGDLIVVPRNVAHRVTNVGTAVARTVIVFSSAEREFVVVN